MSDGLIRRDAVLLDFAAPHKRAALEALCAALAATDGLDAAAALEGVLAREEAAATGLGEGVATPHARLPGVSHPIAAFARLATPLDFDALDGRPVDLVVLLLTPANRAVEHLKALARVARVLRRPEARAALRAAPGPSQVAAVFDDARESHAA